MDIFYLATDFFLLEVKTQMSRVIEVRVLNQTTAQPSREIPFFLNNLAQEIQLYSAGSIKSLTLDETFAFSPTPFQSLVYQTLRSTLPGETLTYRQLAERCGKPQSARAVGSALRKNPFPLIIPCHRVIPAHGKSLGQYSGGSNQQIGEQTKTQLIEMERTLFAKLSSHGVDH